MDNLKIINKYSVLTEIKQIDSNSVLLKFSNHQYFDLEEDIYELIIFGNEIIKYIDCIKEYNLNTPTVVVDTITELDFFVGNMDEDPDWGDWNSVVSIAFEKYNGKFSKKTQEDWDNELMYLIGDQVRTKAFQSVANKEFRNQKYEEIRKMMDNVYIEPHIKTNLNNLLDKIHNLNDGFFYSVFMDKFNSIKDIK